MVRRIGFLTAVALVCVSTDLLQAQAESATSDSAYASAVVELHTPLSPWLLLPLDPNIQSFWSADPNFAADWLDASNWSPLPPDPNTKTYIRNGGTVTITTGLAQAQRLYVGERDNGGGSVIQTGGRLDTAQQIELLAGNHDASYELHGGSLMAGSVSLRTTHSRRVPVFVQSGGVCTLTNSLTVMGLFELSGGELQTNTTHVSGTYSNFQQTGGVHNISDRMRLSHYEIAGGELNVPTLEVHGTFLQTQLVPMRWTVSGLE